MQEIKTLLNKANLPNPTTNPKFSFQERLHNHRNSWRRKPAGDQRGRATEQRSIRRWLFRWL